MSHIPPAGSELCFEVSVDAALLGYPRRMSLSSGLKSWVKVAVGDCFSTVLDYLVSADQMRHVIDCLCGQVDMNTSGFKLAIPRIPAHRAMIRDPSLT